MLCYIDHTKMGRGIHDWLDSYFHFSFAEYYNPMNMNFGELRVINDDLIQPGKGFGTHPHDNMEIISYVVEGELTHGDSMGNKRTLTRGQVQYMSAGTGILHSEYNYGREVTRLLQVWIIPDARGYQPNYGDYRFQFEDRVGKWMPIATWTESLENTAPIRIHQDVNIYATYIKTGETLAFETGPRRQSYMTLIEGAVVVSDIRLEARDALEIIGETILIEAIEDAHIFLVEMKGAA